MKSKLQKANRRKPSSNRWVYRHINDPFVKRAKSENYRSRAAYKLLEINKKFNIIRKGGNVLELGSAPGGWTQVLSNIICGTGRVIAVDLLDMEPLAGIEVVKLDIESQSSLLCEYLGDIKLDVVLSDLAPNTSGSRTTDSIASMRLARLVLEYARKHLKNGGAVIIKILKGSPDEYELVHSLKKEFRKVGYFKPDSSRKASREIYLVLEGKLV